MKLRMVQVVKDVFTPNGGGGVQSFLREKEFDLALEGGFIRVRAKTVSPEKAHVYEIPMNNVACFQRAIGEDLTIPLDGSIFEKPETKKK